MQLDLPMMDISHSSEQRAPAPASSGPVAKGAHDFALMLHNVGVEPVQRANSTAPLGSAPSALVAETLALPSQVSSGNIQAAQAKPSRVSGSHLPLPPQGMPSAMPAPTSVALTEESDTDPAQQSHTAAKEDSALQSLSKLAPLTIADNSASGQAAQPATTVRFNVEGSAVQQSIQIGHSAQRGAVHEPPPQALPPQQNGNDAVAPLVPGLRPEARGGVPHSQLPSETAPVRAPSSSVVLTERAFDDTSLQPELGFSNSMQTDPSHANTMPQTGAVMIGEQGAVPLPAAVPLAHGMNISALKRQNIWVRAAQLSPSAGPQAKAQAIQPQSPERMSSQTTAAAPLSVPLSRTASDMAARSAPHSAPAPAPLPLTSSPPAPIASSPVVPNNRPQSPPTIAVDPNALAIPADQPPTMSAQPTGVPAVSASASSQAPIAQPQLRETAPLERLVDTISQMRESGQAGRGEASLRHGEFGMVSLRVQASEGELHARLVSRDPAFAIAAQTALAEKPVAATNDASQAGQNGPRDMGASQHSDGRHRESGFAGAHPDQQDNSAQHRGSTKGEPGAALSLADDHTPSTDAGTTQSANGLFA